MNRTLLKLRVADLFCGAGGTSTGACEAVRAAGFSPVLTAINHWPTAIATHTANHLEATHLCASVDDVDPRKLYRPGELDLLWASPECTGHSRARGGKPSSDQSRATGHCVTRWAEALQPPIILVENVAEFMDWGPLGTDGKPLKSRKGATFRAWVAMLESLGYRVDWRILCAADYGDPTTRRRLFIQAVRGRRKIVWPNRTHSSVAELAGQQAAPDLFAPALLPWVAARECIDWSHKGRWLDEMPAKKQYAGLPLSPKTLARIHAGLRRYGFKEPYVVTWDHQSGSGLKSAADPLTSVTTKARHGVCEPFLVPVGFSEREGQKARVHSLAEPMPTVVGSGKHGLVQPFLVATAHAGSGRSHSLNAPLPTVCGARGDMAFIEPHLLGQQSCAALRPVSEPSPTVTCDGAIALIEPHLVKFYGTAAAASVEEPLDTVTTKDRFGLVEARIAETLPHLKDRPSDVLGQILPAVEINGQSHRVRLRWRMLQPAELSLAQGFPKEYRFTGTKTDAVKQIGNAVPRHLARALVFAALTQNADVSCLWSKARGPS